MFPRSGTRCTLECELSYPGRAWSGCQNPTPHWLRAGMQRFKIAEVIQAKPILVAAVDILPEQDQADTDDEVRRPCVLPVGGGLLPVLTAQRQGCSSR